MSSQHFANLEASVLELKRIYLDAALTTPLPSADHQELGRAFVTFVHAELEYYVEEVLRELATLALNNAIVGNFSRTSIALLGFSGLNPMSGGTVLSASKKKVPRKLSTRFGDAHNELLKVLDDNHGVREKNLAAMAIPMGLDASSVDNIWLNDLEAFCSLRGGFAHMSRTSQRGNFLAVNPVDVWTKCERLIWRNASLSAVGLIDSFEGFDEWVEGEKVDFGPAVVVGSWRVRTLRFIIRAFSDLRLKRSKVRVDE